MSIDPRITKLTTRKFYQVPGPNPIITAGADDEWDGNFIECCNVIKDGNTYYLYYHGIGKDPDKWPRGYRLGVATAPHPLGPWTKYDQNPVIDLGPVGSWEDHWVACAAVLKEAEDRYYMYYSGNYKVGLAYADNPLGPWRKFEGNPIIADDFGYVGGVVKVDGKYRMYNEYPVGQHFPSPDQGPFALAEADRPEGPWTRHESNPILKPDEWGSWEDGGYSEAGVLYHDGVYHTFYSGTKWEKLETIGYACSVDGVTFHKHVDNPVAPRERNPDAAAFAEVHALWEYPFYYLFHTHRYNSRLDMSPWQEDIGVQVLATEVPFRLSMPVILLETLGPGETSNLDYELHEGKTLQYTGCPPICLASCNSVSVTVAFDCRDESQAGIRVHLKSSANGMEYDTEDLHAFDVQANPGQRVRKTVDLDAKVMFLKVQVENLDGSHSIGDVTVDVALGG